MGSRLPLWRCELSTPSDEWLSSLQEFKPSITAADPEDTISLSCPHGNATFNCDDEPCVSERRARMDVRAKSEADVEYETYRRKQEARERYTRERLEESFTGKLTEAQAAKRGRIESQIMDREALAALPRPAFLIEGLLCLDSLAWVAGESGSYKSFVTLDMAARYATEDMDYHGLPMEHGKVLIVVGEGNSAYIDRVEAWEQYNARPWPIGAHFHNGAVQLGDRDSVAALCALAKDAGYGLVIFDTQAMMTVGVEENSSTEMGVVMNAMHAMREATGACILTVHHFGKSTDNMRGSGAIYAAATTVIVTEREGMQVTLSTKHADSGKQKDAKEEKYVPFVVAEVKVSEQGDPDDRWSLAITSPAKLHESDPRARVVPLIILSDRDTAILRFLEDVKVQQPNGTSLATIGAQLNEDGWTTTAGTPVKSNNVAKWLAPLKERGLIEGAGTSTKITRAGVDALLDHARQAANQGPDDD